MNTKELCGKDGYGTAQSARSAAKYYLQKRDVPLRLFLLFLSEVMK